MKTPLILALAASVVTSPVFADPPERAPAHGYYKEKHDKKHDKKHDRREHKHDDDHEDEDEYDDEHHGEKIKFKKTKHYKGKSGVVYAADYGISAGRCNRAEIGAVIGGASGAVIGGQVAKSQDRVVGMVVGGVIGAVLGHTIGESMDNQDRACMGHALELGVPGVPVGWRHGSNAYSFIPRGDARNGCRYATVSVNGRNPQDVLACPSGRGEWTFRRS